MRQTNPPSVYTTGRSTYKNTRQSIKQYRSRLKDSQQYQPQHFWQLQNISVEERVGEVSLEGFLLAAHWKEPRSALWHKASFLVSFVLIMFVSIWYRECDRRKISGVHSENVAEEPRSMKHKARRSKLHSKPEPGRLKLYNLFCLGQTAFINV